MQQQMTQNQFNQMQVQNQGPPQQFFNQQSMAQHNQQGMPQLNRFDRQMKHMQQPNYPPPNYPQQRMRGPQMVGVGNFQQVGAAGGFDQQQYAMSQGMKSNNMQGGVLPAQLQNPNVMGPPTPQSMSMQQQLMQSVRSPPPNRSPQSNPSPRAQPSASPRAQPSPHHLPSHSPAPQIIGNPGNDMHNHMHPHQSPISGVSVDSMSNVGGNMNVPGNLGGVGVDSIPLTAQDQLTKFVEQL